MKLQDNTKKTKPACPECNNTVLIEDFIRCELYCKHCGLVLVAPPCYGLVFPGVKKKIIHLSKK